MGKYSIREGRVSDCSVIARLVNESSQGAADYLFAYADQAEKTGEDKVSELLASEVHYSYANTLMAEIENEAIGMVLSFPARGLMITEQMEQFYSAQQFQYIQYFADNKLNDSWHLDAMCINSEYRGHGIGTQLLNMVKQQARDYKFSILEVFVFSNNAGAIRFYQRNEFEVCKSIDAIRHEFLSDKSPLVLMRCDLFANN